MSNLIHLPPGHQPAINKIEFVTLPQPDGSVVQVPAAAVIALSPDVIAAIAESVVQLLNASSAVPTEPAVSA